ncbi:organic cation transporter protein-like [Acanthaster planci]|uniref:Organic cation transporter protein-like n=1 Tax=Acanthaster planci TaxID=133434 RepID=A0A8B7ZE86_ACAPL|nr:organic cation transporter protein-like [Acanthaster planci]
MHYEDILIHVGHFGKYQKLVVLALCMIQLPTACQFIAQVFLAADTDHWCLIPVSEAVNCSRFQVNSDSACQEAQKNESIPYKLDSDGNSVLSSCERYVTAEDDGEGGRNATDIIACDAGWDFDRSRYKATINEDFSLVCERKAFAGVAQSVWFAGLLAGSFVWGSVGDWVGRKAAFFLSLSLVTISSIVTSFVPNFAAYTSMRFITAACGYGASLIPIIVSTEIVGPEKRVLVGTLHAIFFALGYILLSFAAFLLREWRYLQLAISLPYVAAFLLIIVFPESPRWLISKSKFKEAKRVIGKIAKVNGTTLPENLFDEGPQTTNLQGKEVQFDRSRRGTHLDLVRTPNIRKKTLIIFFDWFVAVMAYYGLSLSTSALGVDDYIAAFVSGAIEIPSYLFCWFIMERLGRRLSLAGFYICGGAFCLITIFIPLGPARAAVAMIGKFSVTGAFNHIYIYSCEIYPTVVRSIGMGMSSMVGRVSGILCPIILLLGKYWEPLPLCVFGGSSLLAGVLSLMLPETLGYDIPDTIEEGEKFGSNQGFYLCNKSNQIDDNTATDTSPPPTYLPLSTGDQKTDDEAVSA